MTDTNTPSLFGLDNTNRDFTAKEAWGKNQFNSSFPTALCCFIHSLEKTANYLSIKNEEFGCHDISISDAFNIDPLGENTFFASRVCL